MEAIILAGGFGTRLQSMVSDVPKPMAPINGKPFLAYLLDSLCNSQVEKLILSVGYKYDKIQDYFGESYRGVPISYSVEDEPLGTGGAIRKALDYTNDDHVLILNGDTFYNVNFQDIFDCHCRNKADVTLSLKLMTNFDRYGTVSLSSDKVIGFVEKQYQKIGYINCGVYVLNKNIFDNFNLPLKFSFEEFMEKNINNINIFSYSSDGYFIDIGIPEDYEKAQVDFLRLKEE